MNTNPKVFSEDVIFLGRITMRNLPAQASDILTDSTTPDITNLLLVKGSGSIVNITNLLGGRDSQSIKIIGDGTTTLVNGTYIKTNTGANKLLVLNKVYTLSYFLADQVWYENE